MSSGTMCVETMRTMRELAAPHRTQAFGPRTGEVRRGESKTHVDGRTRFAIFHYPTQSSVRFRYLDTAHQQRSATTTKVPRLIWAHSFRHYSFSTPYSVPRTEYSLWEIGYNPGPEVRISDQASYSARGTRKGLEG
ncbi:predicted protein [Coccidioides posadasii str. Silveira]|uniref:Predicted protein n=1 Tax=Coccidioides posadasii (strain RMSCC 757 / Silveira) TaxID=443226 RepID=E9CZV9_COCPS|nr:predicted protein [Coccidioides posadasii str. Silveira]